MGAAPRHLVLIPSYNSGPVVARVAAEALEVHRPVWVVLDGSTDASRNALDAMGRWREGFRVIALDRNCGKGGASLAGMRTALDDGFTHAVLMDADGQHAPGNIVDFLRISRENPDAMILGVPIFGPDAPAARVRGRRVGNWWANLATLWGGIGDSLFGFRAYPLRDAVEVMESISTARRFDFDTELAVRLYWRGVRPINLPVPVRYPRRELGGVTHFRYVRDNALLVGTHARLFFGMLARLPRLIRFRVERR